MLENKRSDGMYGVSVVRYKSVCRKESDVVPTLDFLIKMMGSFRFKHEDRYTYHVKIEQGNIFKKTEAVLTIVGNDRALSDVSSWIKEYLACDSTEE